MDRLSKYLDSWKSADPTEFPFSDKDLVQIIEGANSTEISTHKLGVKKMLITSSATLGTIAAVIIGFFTGNPSADLPSKETASIEIFAPTAELPANSLTPPQPMRSAENTTEFVGESLQTPSPIQSVTAEPEPGSAHNSPNIGTIANSPSFNLGYQPASPRLALAPIDSSMLKQFSMMTPIPQNTPIPNSINAPQGANPFIQIPLHPESLGSSADFIPNYSLGQGYALENLPNYSSPSIPLSLEDIPDRIKLPSDFTTPPALPEEADSTEEVGLDGNPSFLYAADLIRGAERLFAAGSFSLDSANALLNPNDIFIAYADDDFSKKSFLLDSDGEYVYYVDSEIDTTIGPIRYTVAHRTQLPGDDAIGDASEFCSSFTYTEPSAPPLLSMVSSDMRNMATIPLINVKMLPPETKNKIGIENFPTERRVTMATRYSQSCNLFSRDELARAGYPLQGIALYNFSANAKGELKYSLVPYDEKSIDSIVPTAASVAFIFDTLGHYHTIASENPPLVDSIAQTYFVRELDALNKGISFDFITKLTYLDNTVLLHLDFGKSEYPISSQFVMCLNSIGFDSSKYFICTFHPFTPSLADVLQKILKIEKDSNGNIARRTGRFGRHTFGYENNVLAGGIVRDEILRAGKPLPSYQHAPKCKKTASKLADKIDCLTLSAEESKRIGVVLNGSGLSFNTEEIIDLSRLMSDTKDSLSKYGYDTTGKYILLRTKYDIDTGDYAAAKYKKQQQMDALMGEYWNRHFRELPIPYGGWKHDVYDRSCPIGATLVFNSSVPVNTDEKDVEFKNYRILCSIFKKYSSSLMGNYSSIEELLDLSYVNPNDAEDMQLRNRISKYRPQTDRLLPVELHFGDCNKENHLDYSCSIIQIWFYVDREFANLLPDRYRTTILKELDVMDRVDRGELGIGDACRELKEERSYFGLCELENSVISECRVSPVPCSVQELKVDFILTKPRDIKINLYSINSESATAGFEFKGLGAGPNSLRIDLAGVNNGVYLLEVSDGEGNNVKRKVVVAR